MTLRTEPSSDRALSERELWNRCDVCGRFIGLRDFDKGALRQLLRPDSEFTREEWETLCIEHAGRLP